MYLPVFKTRQIGLALFQPLDVRFQRRIIERLNGSLRHWANIVLIPFPVRFIAVNLVFGHPLVGIADANIRAFQPPASGIETRPLRHVHSRNFSGNEKFSVFFHNGEQGADHGGHLVALLRDLFLQVVGVIDPDCLKIAFLIDAEQNYPAAVLIGKAGQGIKKPFRATAACGLDFKFLRFRLRFANRCNKTFQIFWHHLSFPPTLLPSFAFFVSSFKI